MRARISLPSVAFGISFAVILCGANPAPLAPAGPTPIVVAQARVGTPVVAQASPSLPVNPASAVDPAPMAALAGPTELVPYDGAVFLDARKSVSKYPLKWTVVPDTLILNFDADGRKSVVAALPPPLAPDTQYIVTATALGTTDTGLPDAHSITYLIKTKPRQADPIPTPTPTPKPPPDPAPVPAPDPAPPVVPIVAGRIYTMLVFKSGELTTVPLRTGPLASPVSDERKQLAALDTIWYATDDRMQRALPGGGVSPNLFIVEWGLADEYAVSGSPTLFIMGADGKILADSSGNQKGVGIISPSPTTADAVIARVKSLRGIK